MNGSGLIMARSCRVLPSPSGRWAMPMSMPEAKALSAPRGPDWVS